MNKETFDKIYDRATDVCRIKCGNRNTHWMIEMHKSGNPNFTLDTVKQAFSRRRLVNGCEECVCAPDQDFMFAELNRQLKGGNNG